MFAVDQIIEIRIDENGRLHVKPNQNSFPLIWQSATEVHWDEKEFSLYSPKPREWSYLDWYKHIITVISNECSCKLIITEKTKWINIPDDLKSQILKFNH
ncbi:hypothetical protein [Mucilaginibacter limnophilus]|uniref:hypothetical protein n=1 Tax=Mucilaginibacter limnophilus TaxID=1932778 RepID=UPI0013E36E1E